MPYMPTRRKLLSLPAALWLASVHTACSTPPRQGQQPWAVDLPGQLAPQRLWLYLPRDYEQRADWPLVIFLHGSGERGTELDRVKVHGPPMLAAKGADFPFVLASPQLPAGQRWQPAQLHALLQALLAQLRVDRHRVAATGLSLGGHGVWDWAAAHPEDLAGIAPVCGHGTPRDVCRGKQVPVRAYHGSADTVVPLERQQACVDALQACGGDVRFTVFPGVGHDAWTPAYQDPGLVPWLLAPQRRSTPPA